MLKYKTDHQIGTRRKTAEGPFHESVSLHVTQRHMKVPRAIFKKENSESVESVKEDLEDLQDRSSDRIKTIDGWRSLSGVGVTPRDTATAAGHWTAFPRQKTQDAFQE